MDSQRPQTIFKLENLTDVHKNDNWWISQIPLHKWKKYSQTGEEGYIKYILDNIGYGDKKFLVDIGAWDGEHLSNTKCFIDERGFTGLLIDGDNRGNPKVKQEWITAENVCAVLKKHKCPKEFSFLSFDIDGNDYFVIKEILSIYRPRLIVCEVNGTIPAGISKTIKYNPNHQWNNDDYYGFSFSAGLKLAEATGYRVIFQNDSLNLYLVRKDLLADPDSIHVSFSHNPYHPHNPTGEWVEV